MASMGLGFLLSLHKPSPQQEAQLKEAASRGGFNYACPGSSEHAPPLPEAAAKRGPWLVDHERIKVGYGKQAYNTTKQLVKRWGHFQLPWATVARDTPLKPGAECCVASNVFGVWLGLPLKIVYVKEGKWKGPMAPVDAGAKHHCAKTRNGQRFAFASGCLQNHLLAGEERFSVEWDRTNDSVWYDIYTFSRPSHFLAHLGYPVARLMQWRFRQDSMRAVARAVALDAVEASAQLAA